MSAWNGSVTMHVSSAHCTVSKMRKVDINGPALEIRGNLPWGSLCDGRKIMNFSIDLCTNKKNQASGPKLFENVDSAPIVYKGITEYFTK